MNFPLTYLVFKIGMPVYYAWIIRIFVNVITVSVRCIYMKKYLDFPILSFLKKVIKPILIVSVICIPIPYWVSILMMSGIEKIITVTVISILISLFFIYTLGLNVNEKKFINNILVRKILRK